MRRVKKKKKNYLWVEEACEFGELLRVKESGGERNRGVDKKTGGWTGGMHPKPG